MGYKLGLILSGSLVLAVLVVVLLYHVFTTPSDPGGEIKKLMEVKVPSDPPSEVFGPMPSGGDAAGDYRSAVALVESLKADEEWASIDRAAQNLSQLRKIYAAAKPAASKGSMQFSRPEHVRVLVTYKNDPADGLGDMMHALNILAVHNLEQKRYDKSEEILKDMAVMCMHMIKEGVRLRIRQQGIMWQRDTVVTLIEVCNRREAAGDDARTAALMKYEQELNSCMSFIETKGRLILGTDPNPGDIFYAIDNDKDRCWRIRCIAMLGLIKYTASHSRGDSIAVEQYIERFLNSPDPYEAAAAKAAKDLTKQQFRQLSDSGMIRGNKGGIDHGNTVAKLGIRQDELSLHLRPQAVAGLSRAVAHSRGHRHSQFHAAALADGDPGRVGGI